MYLLCHIWFHPQSVLSCLLFCAWVCNHHMTPFSSSPMSLPLLNQSPEFVPEPHASSRGMQWKTYTQTDRQAQLHTKTACSLEPVWVSNYPVWVSISARLSVCVYVFHCITLLLCKGLRCELCQSLWETNIHQWSRKWRFICIMLRATERACKWRLWVVKVTMSYPSTGVSYALPFFNYCLSAFLFQTTNVTLRQHCTYAINIPRAPIQLIFLHPKIHPKGPKYTRAEYYHNFDH